MSKPYKIILVDDEMISRGFMELLIKLSKDYEIAASLPFASDALNWCQEHEPPDLIIMDVMMEKGIDGLTAAAMLKQQYPQVKIIVATSMADADWLGKARDAGIESFWFKTYSELSLTEVMDRTMAGESVYPEEAPAVMLGEVPATALTRQKRNLLRLMIEGLSNREIAERMYLSPNTVKDYVDDLMLKTGIHTVTEKISTKELKRPFVRGDKARSNTEGAGLGLSIAERAALANGFRLKLSCNDSVFKAI